jgi:hypothetical protein
MCKSQLLVKNTKLALKNKLNGSLKKGKKRKKSLKLILYEKKLLLHAVLLVLFWNPVIRICSISIPIYLDSDLIPGLNLKLGPSVQSRT